MSWRPASLTGRMIGRLGLVKNCYRGLSFQEIGARILGTALVGCLEDITMTNQEILGEFLSLPAEAQSQVIDLITFLKQKYVDLEPLSASSDVDLVNDSFVGMWRDRQDLGSATWLRDLRKSEWSKTHG
jgi:hypothetical protein